MIETKRLVLRSWQESDAEALFRYASDPLVGPAAGWPPHRDAEESLSLIRCVLSRPETYAVTLRGGEAVGSISLKQGEDTDMTDSPFECELGYWIGRPYWGQGLMPEAAAALLRRAFEELHMEAVWCGYYDGNTKSARVQEKLGFVYHHTTEGLLVPLLGEVRRGHVTCMTRQRFEALFAEGAAE